MIEKYKVRSTLIFLLLCIAYTIIIIHLFSLQIIHHNFFINLANQQYKIVIKTMPPRSLIYDRNNKPLTMNKDSLSAFILPKQITDQAKVLEFLTKYFPKSIERLNKNKNSHFMYIKRRLSDEEFNCIEQCGLEDIKILKEPGRYYTTPSLGSLIGITDIDNKGLFGIEALYDDQLAGTPTTVCLEKDARSGHFYFTKETRQYGDQGNPVSLTLDSDLQFLVHEELCNSIQQLNAQEGAVMIINPDNGEILALTNYPNFDPNNTQQLSIDHTKNIVFTDVHELGSVMKPFVALALLEEQLVDPAELIDCENRTETFINGVRVTTWKSYGLLPFSEVVQRSNNIGIAKVAARLKEKLYDHYKKVGFEQKVLNWPAEQLGFINPPSKWTKFSPISLSFGYELSATLAQLARAFAIIANGGYFINLNLIKQTSYDSSQKKKIYSDASISQIQKMLEKTVTQGTANRAQLEGYNVMGKTGTANIIVDGKYIPADNIYVFAGIVQKGNYNRIIITFIKIVNRRGLYASGVAAPLFERIAHCMLIHEKVLQ